MKEWEDQRKEDDAAAWEDNPDKPNLEEMMSGEIEKLTTTRENDEAFFEALKEELTTKQVKFVDEINTDVSAEFANLKIIDRLHLHLK